MSTTLVSKLQQAKIDLYRRQGRIHARAVQGRFNNLRWIVVWITQAVFYGGCWLDWESKGTVRQAILFDIPHDKFYLFGLVFWPQDALLLAIVLILAALGLFFVTSLYGRIFCGFACPQTVYTSIFTWIEAKVEGDHLERLKLDRSHMSGRKLVRKTFKHAVWTLVALWTAITFVGYFTPIKELLPSLGALQLGPWESFWLPFYAVFTYAMAALARESVCQHMCPYSRFQGVMFDPATANVAYDARRGEPRSQRNAGNEAAGACIDCGICVQVCPTGIDIRNGLQYQCTNCGLCIDACDQVMTRIGAPAGLVRFASMEELDGRPPTAGALVRPRVAWYAATFVAFACLGAWVLHERILLRVDVQRDRSVMSRETADGGVENAFLLKLMNLDETPHRYRIEVSGLTGAQVVGPDEFAVESGSVRPVSLAVSAPGSGQVPGSRPIEFRVVALHDAGVQTVETSRFLFP